MKNLFKNNWLYIAIIFVCLVLFACSFICNEKINLENTRTVSLSLLVVFITSFLNKLASDKNRKQEIEPFFGLFPGRLEDFSYEVSERNVQFLELKNKDNEEFLLGHHVWFSNTSKVEFTIKSIEHNGIEYECKIGGLILKNSNFVLSSKNNYLKENGNKRIEPINNGLNNNFINDKEDSYSSVPNFSNYHMANFDNNEDTKIEKDNITINICDIDGNEYGFIADFCNMKVSRK